MRIKTMHLFLVMFMSLAIPLPGWADTLAIIVNGKNPVGELSLPIIQKLFLKERTAWPNGDKVKSVDREGDTLERSVFLRDVLKLSPIDLEKHWVAKRYEKGLAVPQRLKSDQEVIEFVISEAGGLGYVNMKNLDPSQRKMVVIVNVIPLPD